MARELPFFIYALLFSSGVIVHRFLPELISQTGSVVALMLACGLAFLGPRMRWVAVLMLGVLWANSYAGLVLAQALPAKIEGRDVVVSGTIIGVPERFENLTRFEYRVETLVYRGKSMVAPGKIRLKVYHPELEYRANQSWQFTVRLRQPRSYHNPGMRFSYETWLFQNRIRATGYVTHEEEAVLLNDRVSPFATAALRQTVYEHISHRFVDHPLHGVLSALVVGTKGQISAPQWQVFQATGTIHLVAISGLHIGLVAALVIALFRFLLASRMCPMLNIPMQVVATCMGLGAAFGYALLAGMTIPTRRAFIMVAVLAIALGCRRRPGPLEPLCLALFAVLAVDPLAPLSPGFWLSFWAVFVILLSLRAADHPPVPSRFNRIKHASVNLVYLQGALSIGMLPMLAALFAQISWASPLANIIAIPVVSLMVVPLALLGLCFLLSGLGPVGDLFFDLALKTLAVLWHWLDFLADHPWSIHWLPQVPFPLTILFCVGCLGLFKVRMLAARLLFFTWLLPVFLYAPPSIPEGEFRYTMLDVGHGLASVVRTKNHTMVYDFGPGPPGSIDMGDLVLHPFLQYQGITDIDLAIVSHGHQDHRGGYPTVARRLLPARVLSGEPKAIARARSCYAGQRWHWDGVDFEVLWPPQPDATDLARNNRSCVVQVRSRTGSLLLTGDIEKSAEARLVRTFGTRLHSDVLQVPHQGSKTSSSSAFIDAVAPRLAVVSTGHRNRFGHPHEVVVNRYARRDLPLYRTDQSGALTVTFGPRLSIEETRNSAVGYWYN